MNHFQGAGRIYRIICLAANSFSGSKCQYWTHPLATVEHAVAHGGVEAFEFGAWRGEQWLEGSVDLARVLDRVGSGELGEDVRGAVATSLGHLLRRLHGFGLIHADLQPRNLLVLEEDLAREDLAEPLPIWVIDLDRSAFVGDLTEPERRGNLRRLFRAIDRRDKRGGRYLRQTDFTRFFRAYDASGKRWKTDWRRILADHARSGPAHWTGQLFERTFSRGDDRDRRLDG